MEFSAIPLAFIAGVLSLLSPCVLPMIPAVTGSALRASNWGLLFLAAGLSLSFAVAGSLLTYLLLSLELSPDVLRTVSAVIMLVMALLLISKPLGEKFSQLLSRGLSYLPNMQIDTSGSGSAMQFLVGATLGLVWLPCVGPTLGTAIALASQGNDMLMAFTVMLSFGLGSALPLIALAFFAGQLLSRLRASAEGIKLFMGISLLLLAVTVLTGFDRTLEIWAMQILPSWAIEI